MSHTPGFRPDFAAEGAEFVGLTTGYVHDPRHVLELIERSQELGIAAAVLAADTQEGQLVRSDDYRISHGGTPTREEHDKKVAEALKTPGEYVD